MTTALTHAVHGRLWAALATQPAGLAAALGLAMIAWVSAWVALTGMPLGPVIKAVWRPATVWLIGAVVLASWAYKCLAIYGLGR